MYELSEVKIPLDTVFSKNRYTIPVCSQNVYVTLNMSGSRPPYLLLSFVIIYTSLDFNYVKPCLDLVQL